MVSPSTRSTRSRYSSPRQTSSGSVDPTKGQRSASASGSGSGGSGNASGSGGKSRGNGAGGVNSKSSATEGQKTFMDRWLEPPVQNKPSFADAGLVRHGVVEGMAPLGTMPKAGFFKKATPAPQPPESKPFKPTRIVIKRTAAPPPPAPAPAATILAPEEDETEDEEESGNGSLMTGADETGSERMTPAPIYSATTRRPLPVSQIIATSNGLVVDPQSQFLDAVVAKAVDEAVAHHRFPTAWALKTLHQEGNPKFRILAEKVFMQTADAGVLEEFAQLLHEKKREARRANLIASYAETMRNAGQAPPNPRRASYDHLVKYDISAVRRYREAGEQQRTGSGEVKQEEAGHEGVQERVRELQQTELSVVVQQPLLHQQNQQDLQYRQRLQFQQDQRQPQRYQTTDPEPGPHPKPNPEQESEPGQPVKEPQPELAPTSEPALEHLPLDPQLLNPPHQQSPPSPQPSSPPQQKQNQQAPQPELVSDPAPRPLNTGGKRDKEQQEYEDRQSHSDPPLDLSSSHTGQDPEKVRGKEQELLLASTKSATTPALALAPALAPASLEPEQERRSPDHEQETKGGNPEVHVRKKLKASPRKSESAKAKMVVNGVNGKAKSVSPKKRARASSISSSSSLSSARSLSSLEDVFDGDGINTSFAIPASPSRASPASIISPAAAVEPAATGAADGVEGGNQDAVAPHPITVRRRINVRRNKNVSPALPSPASPTGRQSDSLDPANRPYEMPAVVDAPLFPNLSSKKGSKSGVQGVVFPSKVGRIDENDPKYRLRLSAKNISTNNNKQFPVSFTRESYPAEEQPSVEAEEMLVSEPTTEPMSLAAPETTTRATSVSAEGRSTRASRKRSHVELEDQPSSPTAAAFPASDAASTAANSRAATPVLRPAKKPRTGLRVKNSPMKKKTSAAGMPRASGERSSPTITNGNYAKEDDNDDYCSSCGGNGQLICCDGCTRSFHFSCVDPPLMQGAMPDEWFCNVCRTAHNPPAFPEYSGPFALLMEKLDTKNSSAFALPLDVREYFEAVRTGQDGEYEEIVPLVKPPAKRKKNDEESGPDFFRLRDDKGDPVTCHLCKGGAVPRTRVIIPCSLCGLYWHLDCLDPPLTNPPVLRTWRCPCHVDDLLAKVPGQLAPAHKFRKIKGASVVKPAYGRAYVNNGYVEIDPEASDDETGWRDVETYGRVVRLPAKGIKLDFLSRVRENRKGKPIPPLNISQPTGTGASSSLLNKRSLEEQQAVYNLAALSGQGANGVNTLVDVLLAEADPSIISLMASGNSNHLASGKLNHMDQQSLRAMLAQMEKMTSQIKNMLEPFTPVAASQDQLVSSKVPSLTNSSQSITDGESENTVRDLDTTPTVKKELPPSPAATDDVATTKQTKEPAGPRRKKRKSNGRKSADSDAVLLQNGDMNVDA